MGSPTSRVVLAFYSDTESESSELFRSVRKAHRRDSALIRRDGSVDGRARLVARYAPLRLAGETLLIVRISAGASSALVQALSRQGSPSVFVLADRIAEPEDKPATSKGRRPGIFERLDRSQAVIEIARLDLVEAMRLDHALPAAAEWLLDNTYLVRTQIADVKRHLPQRYSEILPVSAPSNPLTFDLARKLVDDSGGAIDEGVMTEFLNEQQRERPLQIAELWLFPLLLRTALVETTANLAAEVDRGQELREAAYLWANRLAATAHRDTGEIDSMLRQMANQPYARQGGFAASLAEQLQDEEEALAPAQRWIEEQFGKPVAEMVHDEHAAEADQRLTISRIFNSLRVLARINFQEIFEATSVVNAILAKDPGNIYAHSDFVTRDRCRRVIERIARYSRLSETEVAARAISLAANSTDPRTGHVAHFLLADGVTQLESDVHAGVPGRIRLTRALRRHGEILYTGSTLVLSVAMLMIVLRLAWESGGADWPTLTILGVLALFPLSELSLQILNALVISLIPPDPLPKMDFEKGIPDSQATLVIVPMMLIDIEAVRREVEKLEIRYIANPDAHLIFGLFSDYLDAPEKDMPVDSALLAEAVAGIDRLNARYATGSFVLFHRERVWSESEQVWMGHERKRGKIGELNEFLLGHDSTEILRAGKLPNAITNVITLDADTRLPPDAARRLVETIAHPLNHIELDPETHVRRRGFAVIQPRVSISLPDATASRFTRVFADTSGTDPYTQSVSDAHQDLFGEASFHGKAIYNVAAFRDATHDRFPTSTILSHDLIEGAHAGVALATDVELFENLPLDYSGYVRREHRWIRGDWQIARWILPRVPSPHGPVPNPLSFINRWRIFDNLRRSLVPIASVLLLLFGWLISASPGVWSLVVGLALAIPAIAPLLDRLARRFQGTVHRWKGAGSEFVRALVVVAFLPHQAWVTADAIARSLYRSFVSRHKMLEWQTAEAAQLAAERTQTTFRQLLTIAAITLLIPITQRSGVGSYGSSVLFMVLWIAAPWIMRFLSQPTTSRRIPNLASEADGRYLRIAARRTWRYFDDLVNGESNWLPPDNSQLALRVEIAQRTSPTNIGFWLTSALAATDFGYITVDDFIGRCEHTVETLGRLERCEGHLLNWYNTATLEPLLPKYVSTVDSGNLLASCWIMQQGCRDLIARPIASRACVRGLHDTSAIFREVWGNDPSVAAPVRTMQRLLKGKVEGHRLVSLLRTTSHAMEFLQNTGRWHEPDDERAYWLSRTLFAFKSWNETMDRYLRWAHTLIQPPDSFLAPLGPHAARLRLRAIRATPSLSDLRDGIAPLDSLLARRSRSGLNKEILSWLGQISEEYEAARRDASATIARLDRLAAQLGELAAGMKMGFLYDRNRRLFGVGYAVGGPVEFSSHYDLLASECRLASIVAIAKGDVPKEHWYALGKPQMNVDGRQVTLSWSGTMFEYLMPLLYMKTYSNSLIEHACREAVSEQISWTKPFRVPWGISESASGALDSNQIYQYRAFGVPSLALSRVKEEQPVVAPYATMLALLVNPSAAVANLRALEDFRLAGPMGFYEAIDFRLTSKEGAKPGVRIRSYMAHHQGMSLMALDNALHQDVMRDRFHRLPSVRAFEPLLFERVPIAYVSPELSDRDIPTVRVETREEPADRAWREDTVVPRVHLQGNGRYSVLVTNSGGGYSRWNGQDLTRWRSDTTLDSWGDQIYIRDLKTALIWTASHHGGAPGGPAATVHFWADRAEFRRRNAAIETSLTITVSPEDDVELRRLVVTNASSRVRELEFTSYVELSLSPHRADTAHPAFAKMFVETECPENGVLIAHRRPRSPEDTQVWAAHVLIGADKNREYETDRMKFLGRGNTPSNPQAIEQKLTGTTGTVLDPIFSLRGRLTLDPRDRKEIIFLTMAAGSREALLELIEKYRHPGAPTRAFEVAWTRSQLDFRYLGIGPASAHRFQELAGYMLYPHAQLRASSDRIVQNRLGQSGLWALGISGDLPIISIAASESRHAAFVREVLLAHTYWRMRGFEADLIVLNQEGVSYDRPLHQQLQRLIEAHSTATGIDRPGGVFLRDWDTIPEDHRNLILASSAVVLNALRGPLQQQLAGPPDRPAAAAFTPTGNQEFPSAPLAQVELVGRNGIGGFTPDGREYVIDLPRETATPVPWGNVMANSSFGCMVTESGLGFTWNGNSQSNRLTPWHNDPVADPQSDCFYLRDAGNGAIWSPTPLPIRENDAYRVRHGQGYSIFEHTSHGIEQNLTVFVPLTDRVRICRLRLRNSSSASRSLSVFHFAEWVLGSVREDQQLHIRTWLDAASGALCATQSWNSTYGGRVTFTAAAPRAQFWSGDRGQFLGRGRQRPKPAALTRLCLDNRTGTALDPASALQLNVDLDSGQSTELIFLLGECDNLDAMRSLVARYAEPQAVENALSEVRDSWNHRLAALEVQTPSPSVNFLLNRWLLWQTLSCRMWGRSALYQSSGAFGFRDQLQDSLALLYAEPDLTRSQIVRCAARQFREGDVQHWWHADTGNGVRTLCSDDLIWMPYAAARYVQVTGDTSILDEQIPFLEAPELKPGEHEVMSIPGVSAETATLAEHCRRALDRGWKLGAHGLPLMGNGDWNDGMNRVGIEGRGESVWLAWFLCATLRNFASTIDDRARDRDWAREAAAIMRGRAAALVAATNRTAWDGQWYVRAFFDDGSPLGSHSNEENQIDSLSQSWAVLADAAPPLRARTAMESANRLLVDEPNRLVRLFTPPFDHSKPHPGYIMGYPPGVRENGGQYTHGSLWMAAAWARLGNGDAATRLLMLMNPIESSRTPELAARYRAEPYVAAADVSSAPGHEGQAGWTWYTGSAGWMYRIWIEEVLGFRLTGDRLTIRPALPSDWDGFEIRYRYRTATYEISVRRRNASEQMVEVDGNAVESIHLADDGAVHHATVWIPRRNAPQEAAPHTKEPESVLEGSSVR